jgi:luciferase-like monooxygenase
MNQTITRSTLPRDHRIQMLPNAMAAIWSRTSMLKEFWELVQAVGTWPGAVITRDRSGLCLTLNGVNLGHLDWDGRLVLPFEPEMQNELVAEKMANREPDYPNGGHAIIDVRTADDVDRALWLLRFAYLSGASKQDTCRMAAAQRPRAQF